MLFQDAFVVIAQALEVTDIYPEICDKVFQVIIALF